MKYLYDTIERIDTMFTENATRAIHNRIQERRYYGINSYGMSAKHLKFRKDFNRTLKDPTAYLRLRKHVRMMMTLLDDL